MFFTNLTVSHQLCIWYLSVEEGHVITLSFRNFSLETQDVCEFDYVEVHDSIDTGAGRVLGRWDPPQPWFLFPVHIGWHIASKILSLLFKSCLLRVNKSKYVRYITTMCSFCLPLSQVLWYHLPSRPDLLRPPHDCGVCGWWGSGRQRLQRNIPGCVCAGQWVPANFNIQSVLLLIDLWSFFLFIFSPFFLCFTSCLCSPPSFNSYLFNHISFLLWPTLTLQKYPTHC